MPYYRSVGELPRKRHTQFRQPDGSLYTEELMGQEGFSSDSSLLYHRHAPTAIVAAEVFTPPAVTARRTCARSSPPTCDTHKLDADGARPDPRPPPTARNDDVRYRLVLADRPSRCSATPPADHACTSSRAPCGFESTFGVLDAVAGDYVVNPTSTDTGSCRPATPRCGADDRGQTVTSAPKRYLSARGQFMEHAPYCERDVRGPDTPLLVEGPTWRSWLRHRYRAARPGGGRHGWTRQHLRQPPPFDVVGWDGHMYPWAVSSTTSSRSPGGSTNRPRCTRPSRAPTS